MSDAKQVLRDAVLEGVRTCAYNVVKAEQAVTQQVDLLNRARFNAETVHGWSPKEIEAAIRDGIARARIVESRAEGPGNMEVP